MVGRIEIWCQALDLLDLQYGARDMQRSGVRAHTDRAASPDLSAGTRWGDGLLHRPRDPFHQPGSA